MYDRSAKRMGVVAVGLVTVMLVLFGFMRTNHQKTAAAAAGDPIPERRKNAGFMNNYQDPSNPKSMDPAK